MTQIFASTSFKKRPQKVLEKFNTLSLGDVAISSITLAELYYGIMKSSNPKKNQEALDKFLTPIEILNFDFCATIEYGKIRADLEKNGTPIGSLDTLIAAHAKSLNLSLVTNNQREFKRIPDLKIENWAK